MRRPRSSASAQQALHEEEFGGPKDNEVEMPVAADRNEGRQEIDDAHLVAESLCSPSSAAAAAEAATEPREGAGYEKDRAEGSTDAEANRDSKRNFLITE